MPKHALSITAPAHPWRRVARTAFALIPAIAVLLPQVLDAGGINDTAPAVAAALAVAAAVTRILALPSVEVFLRRFAPWLSAGDVQAEDVVAQLVPAPIGTDVDLVAGPAHPAPTGTPVALPPVARPNGPGGLT